MYMRSKKNIYFLLPAALLIWGLLVYRIFLAIQPVNASTNSIVLNGVFKPAKFVESEAFTIKADYRDPFLGSINTKKPRPKTQLKTKPQPKKPFPQVTYKGVVSGNNSKVFIVSIDGKQYFFKKYQTQNNMKLINGSSKSVTLRFQGQQQTFLLVK